MLTHLLSFASLLPDLLLLNDVQESADHDDAIDTPNPNADAKNASFDMLDFESYLDLSPAQKADTPLFSAGEAHHQDLLPLPQTATEAGAHTKNIFDLDLADDADDEEDILSFWADPKEASNLRKSA